MRIGLDLTHCYQRNGGIQRYAIQLARALLEIDAQNQYVLFFRGDVREEFTDVVAEIHVSPIKHQVLCEQTWLFMAASRAHLDVFHLTGFAGPVAYSGRAVTTICDMSQFLYPSTMKRSQKMYWSWLFPFSLRQRERLITISANSQNDISRLLHIPSDNITVIPLAASPVFSETQPKQTLKRVTKDYALPDRFFLAVGTLEPRKNHVRLLEAYARVVGEYESAPPLVFAGRQGWLYEPVMQRIIELGLTERVSFTGFVTDTDLFSIYRLAVALLYPSIYEGFGLPILEAMASGCPVLTSNVSSMPEVAGNAAHYVDPLDVNSLTSGIRAMLDEKYRAELADRGYRRARQFSWKRTAQETLAIYTALRHD